MNGSIFTGAEAAGAIPPSATIANGRASVCRHQPQGDVSICPTSVEQELDDAIQSLRTISALAEDRGDIETAKELSRRMLEAIHSRSPQHIARLDQEALDALRDAEDYFQAQGDRHRTALYDVSAQAVRRRMA